MSRQCGLGITHSEGQLDFFLNKASNKPCVILMLHGGEDIRFYAPIKYRDIILHNFL